MAHQQTVDALHGEVGRLKLELESLQISQGKGTISIGNYLLTRLAQPGVTLCLSLTEVTGGGHNSSPGVENVRCTR